MIEYMDFPGRLDGKEPICDAGRFNSWVGKICWRKDMLPTPVFLCFLGGSAGKKFPCNVGDLSLIPGLERFPGKGNIYPLQYSGLENSMEYTVHGILQARILEWVAIPFSRESFQPTNQIRVSCIAGGFFTN